MKFVRSVTTGIVLGGAFGARIGAYLTQVFDERISFQAVEFGFILGVSSGLMISLIIQLMNSGILEQRERINNSLTLAAQS